MDTNSDASRVGATAVVPGSGPAAAGAGRAARKPREVFSAPRVLQALDVTIPKDDPPAAYGAAVAGLAAFLVLVSLAYLALVVLVGWLAAWHALQAVESLAYGPYFIFHLPMALLGAVLLVFLVKPVFFRHSGAEEQAITLAREQEPVFFAVVDKLCAAAGAPAPARIEVDCEPNAGARTKMRYGGLVGGELVLRVGLPLASGLTVRQFTGVLAHEFGHFNQRSGMAGSHLVRRLTAFFAQVVFQRDRLDDRLSRVRLRRGLPRLFYFAAVALIEPARGVLWLMLLCGELTACGVLRRMEYDADDMEAHVAGVDDFVRTGRALMFLNIAVHRARADVASAWEQQRLADDFPRLVVANARQLAEHRTDILKVLDATCTRWFDTHPCHSDRAANVRRLGAGGLVSCDASARHLFADFEGLCRRATAKLYADLLGQGELNKVRLVPTRTLVEERTGERQAFKALRRFFQGHVVGRRPVFPSADEAILPVNDVPTAVRELAAARDALLAAAPTLGPAAHDFGEAAARLPIARGQIMLADLFSVARQAAAIKAKGMRELLREQPRLDHAACRLDQLDGPARTRLTLGMQLLHTDGIAARLGPDAPALRRSVHDWLNLCFGLEQCLPDVNHLADLATLIRILSSTYNAQKPYPPLVRKILAATNDATGLLRDMQSMLEVVPYPFAHGTEGTSVAAALLPSTPKANDPVETLVAILRFADRFYTLTFRVLSQLTRCAERVEAAVGFAPLPDPQGMDDPEADAEKARDARKTRRYWIGYGLRAAAGVVLVSGLVRMSIRPPALPAMAWQHTPVASAGGAGNDDRYYYRPAAFGERTVAPAPPAAVESSSAGNKTGVPVSVLMHAPAGAYRGRVIDARTGQAAPAYPPRLLLQPVQPLRRKPNDPNAPPGQSAAPPQPAPYRPPPPPPPPRYVPPAAGAGHR